MIPGEKSGDNSALEGHYYYTVSTLIIKAANARHAGLYTCVSDLPGERKTESYNVQVVSTTSEDVLLRSLKRSRFPYICCKICRL